MANATGALPTLRGARVGHGRVVARRCGATTVLAEARATSPFCLVHPTFPAAPVAAAVCLVTFGGGLVDGDSIAVDMVVERGATLLAFTQASTKVFRGSSTQRLRAQVEGTLVLVPDPVAAFAGARYTQRVEVELVGAGSCVLLDGFTSGRPAFGERWAMDGLDLRTTVSLDGEHLVRDALVLDARDGAIADRLDRFEAASTLIAVGHGASPVVRSILELGSSAASFHERGCVVAASPLPAATAVPGAIARVFATSPSRAMTEIRRRLGNLPEMEAVDPFASRH